MNLFGVGPLELVLVLLLALIVFGPKDLEKAGKSIGKTLNQIIHSESWQAVQKTRRELKNIPGRLMRESGLDEVKKATSDDMNKIRSEIKQAIPPEMDKQD